MREHVKGRKRRERMHIRECRNKVRKTEKRFYRMVKYLKRKGNLELSGGCVYSWWKTDEPDYPYLRLYRYKTVPAMYEAACRFFPPELAPFAAETLHIFDTACYHNQYANLVGMLTVDHEVCPYGEEYLTEKLAILSAAFSWMGERDVLWLNDYRRQPDYRELEEAARAVRKEGWERYHDQITVPFIRTLAVNGASDIELYGDISYEANPEGKCDWEGIAEKLHVDKDLDRTAVKFLIEDAYDYIWGCDGSEYNPYWIYGSGLYGELMERNAALPWEEWRKEAEKRREEWE